MRTSVRLLVACVVVLVSVSGLSARTGAAGGRHRHATGSPARVRATAHRPRHLRAAR